MAIADPSNLARVRSRVVAAFAVGSAVAAIGYAIATTRDDETDERRRDDYEVCAELAAAVDRYRSMAAGSDILAVRAMLDDLDTIAAQAVGTKIEGIADAAAEATLEDTPDARDAFLAECERQGLIEQP